MKIGTGCALIIVDVQRDFCPGGSLAVPDGDEVVQPLNEYIEKFKGAPIFATRDWHPPDHISFKERGGIWPTHCVQNSQGAEFHPELKLPENVQIISKATSPDKEAYSGFEGTDLAERLRKLGVKKVFIGGIATDYCVKATVLDAIKNGFETYVLKDAIKGVNADDCERAVLEMKQKGAEMVTLFSFFSFLLCLFYLL